MVSCRQGCVPAASAKPPQRSTTVSPSSVAQNEAPMSAPLARLASNAARTGAYRSCVNPCVEPSAMARFPLLVHLMLTGARLGGHPAGRGEPPERDHERKQRQIGRPEHPDRQ